MRDAIEHSSASVCPAREYFISRHDVRLEAAFMSVARLTLACMIALALIGCSGNGSTIRKPSNLSSLVNHKIVQAGKQWLILPLPAGGTDPELITNGPDGNVWFTETAGNSIDQANVVTGVITRFPISDPNVNPIAIAVSADGNFWFCEGSSPRIGVMTPLGVYSSYPLPVLCNSLAATSDGSLWANSGGGIDLQKITSTGVTTEFPVPSGRPVMAVATGSDGNVWFTEQNRCPPQCFNHRVYGKIDGTGSINEYTWIHPHKGFSGRLVLGPDGDLYTFYGDGYLLRIAPDGSPTPVFGPGGVAELVAGRIDVFFSLTSSGGLSEGGPSAPFNFLGWPPNGRKTARSMALAGDGNLWITQGSLNTIAIYLRHRIKPVPTSISVTVGNSEQLNIHEQSYSGGWQVTSTDPTIATVTMISNTQYSVFGVKSGTCSVLITDTKNNQLAVPVAVN
jgi:streptogramin lyase